MVDNLVGPIPEPENLYGRDNLIDDAWSLLAAHNLLLLAPRRFGKSGMVRHLKRRPRRGVLPVSFDVEDVISGPEFVKRIVEQCGKRKELAPLLKRVGGAVGEFVDAVSRKVEEIKLGESLPGLKLRQAIENTDWQVVAREVMLSLEQAEQPLLFLFDELPEMLRKIAHHEGDDSVKRFLAWFRTIRLDDRDELRRHRFVVAGSTGLNYLVDRRLACPETLGDFQRLVIEPLELPDAARLCRDLAAGYQVSVTEDAVEHLLSRIGQPVPYFIQMFFSQFGQQLDKVGSDLTADVIDTVYQARMMGPYCKRYFDRYRRRLDQYEPMLEQAAIHILVEIARGAAPVPTRALYEVYAGIRTTDANSIEFSELLADLECDWYLQYDGQLGTYSFYMNVMRDWWHRWYHHVRDVSQKV